MLFSVATIVSLLATSATLVSGASVMRPFGGFDDGASLMRPVGVDDGDNGSCDRLQALCYDKVVDDFSSIWSQEPCVFAGVCYERSGKNLDDFLKYMWKRVGKGDNPPPSVTIPRMNYDVFNIISRGGSEVTQQNYIDAYYGVLNPTGPYPTKPDVVIADFHRIASWVNICNGGIPYDNFADYFQYSASHPADFCKEFFAFRESLTAGTCA